jgi:uncharacterized protein (TIGR03086 family)
VSSPRPGAAPPPAPSYVDGPALLERAVGYTRSCLRLLPGHPTGSRTPCAEWDLLALLRHMDDSLAAFTEAADIGYVDLVPVRTDGFASRTVMDIADRLRVGACAVLAAWAHHPGPGAVLVGGRPLRSDLLAAAGALEIAVHGWDVAQACGGDLPLPAALGRDLLRVLPLLVHDDDRPHRFADPVDVPPQAPPGTRLLAAVGRRASRP